MKNNNTMHQTSEKKECAKIAHSIFLVLKS